jgi:DNA-binding NarL/FixJ family response regulator
MTLSPHRIVVLAPQPVSREALRWALESEPDLLVVAEAADGQEALLGASSLHPEVILLDDVARSGIDVIALTRALKATPHAPATILLATAGDADVRRRFTLAGGDALVEKGAGWPALIAAIRAALAVRALRPACQAGRGTG